MGLAQLTDCWNLQQMLTPVCTLLVIENDLPEIGLIHTAVLMYTVGGVRFQQKVRPAE